jgi:DNA-binding NtrC family response regulator
MNSQSTANAQDQTPGKGSEDLNVRALLVSPYVDDLLPLQQIFNEHDWDLEQVDNYKGARQFFTKDRVPIVIWNVSLTDGSWRDLVSQLAPLPEPPRVFLISPADDPSLTAEAREQADVDVFTTPFNADDVWQRLRSAWLVRRRKSPHRMESTSKLARAAT